MEGRIIHQEFHRLHLAVGNPVDGHRRAGLILHSPDIPDDVIAAQLLGADHAAQSQRVNDGMVFHPSQLGDHLGNSLALAVQGHNHVQLVHARQADQGIGFGQALTVKNRVIRAVAQNHRDLRQQCGQLPAPGLVLFHELDGNAVAIEHIRQVVADPAAAAEHNIAHPPGNDPQAAQHIGQIMGRGGDEDPIPLPEDEITLRGDGSSAAQYRTDQHPAVDNAVHVAQRHVAQLAGLINAQLHDLHPPLGEGIPLQKARILQKIRNFLGGLLLRVDGHGQTEHILHGVDLLGILRIPDSGNGVQVGIQIVGGGAAQQVNFVCIGGGNQKIRLLHACLEQDVHGHTVAGNRHHIVLLQGFLQNMGVLVDQGHIVALGRQQPCQRGAYLAVTGNNNVHKPLQI